MFPLGHSDVHVTIILRMPCLLLGILGTKLRFLFPITKSQFLVLYLLLTSEKMGKSIIPNFMKNEMVCTRVQAK